ncbi:MAG: O-methyltransferase [Clostridia bacterium]|nr:O-methyltransferase [Clostridia bacterium]
MNIEEIKKEALKQHIPIIMDETLEVIKKVLIEKQPKRILEIGTATGYSSLCFANILNNQIYIDTIELDEIRANEAINNIKQLGLEKCINVIKANAVEVLPILNESYDIIFIDAAKGKYPIFLKEAIRLSHKGSVILADNILYKGYVMSDYNKHKQRTAVKGLREYLKLLEENKEFETQLINVGDGLTISNRRN